MSLTSQFGSLAIPVPVPTQDTVPAGDPGLRVLGEYLQAVLTTYAGAAWEAIAPGEPIVRNVFYHDPDSYEFSSSDLPALFVFRDQDSKPAEKLAEDFLIHFSSVRIFWVSPEGSQERKALRWPFWNAVTRVVYAALEAQRDPSYVMAGDTDTQAATRGSFLRTAGGWYALAPRSARPTTLVINMIGPGEPMVFDALDIRIDTQERLAVSATADSYPAKIHYADIKIQDLIFNQIDD